MKKNDILNSTQYGFRTGKNTTMLLSTFTDQVNSWLDQKLHVLALFIDFSRAFDILDHNILVQRLENTGIRGPLLKWCENYLRDRSYCVKICDSFSASIKVSEGTAQGSVLGPLHFIAYINNMSKLFNNCITYQYADDTCMLVAAKDVNEGITLLQEDFDMLNKWCHDSHLVLNPQKTKLIHIHSPNLKVGSDMNCNLIAHTHSCLHNPSNHCGCPSIEVVLSHKYLGLTIDHNFNWHKHINYVCDKLRSFLANIFIIKSSLTYKSKIMLYNALADSIISYGLSSYGRTDKTYLSHIYRLQVRILKNIVPLKIKVQETTDENFLFKYCQVIPIYNKIKFTILKENYFDLNFQNKISHKVGTRNMTQNKLVSLSANNKYGQRTRAYMVPYLINNLDTIIRNKITEGSLNQLLQKYYLNL